MTTSSSSSSLKPPVESALFTPSLVGRIMVCVLIQEWRLEMPSRIPWASSVPDCKMTLCCHQICHVTTPILSIQPLSSPSLPSASRSLRPSSLRLAASWIFLKSPKSYFRPAAGRIGVFRWRAPPSLWTKQAGGVLCSLPSGSGSQHKQVGRSQRSQGTSLHTVMAHCQGKEHATPGTVHLGKPSGMISDYCE